MMKQLMTVLMLFWFMLLFGGCATTLTNQGEVGARWGTEFTFFSRAAKTSDEPATAKVEVPGLTELILGETEADDAPDG